MIIKGSRLSRRPDTPIPIPINPSLRGESSLHSLRIPLNTSNNQFSAKEEKQSPHFPSRSTTPSKRRRIDGFCEDLFDLDEDGDQSPSDSVKRFACPYFRKNPERHLECINLKMVRISDVKQHLKRRHTAPYPCPICSEGFASLNLQGNHILQQACSPGLGANWDSVSLTSQKALQARFGKKLSQEAQWYGIWKILFGKPSNMPKPHLDGVVKEVIGILRGIWLDEGRRLISEFVQAKDQPPSYNDQLYQLLAGILDDVEARFEQKSSERSSRKTSIGSEQGPEESSGVQLDTTFDFPGTEDAFPTDDSGGCVLSYNTATLPVDVPATASEVSKVSYQTSEFNFPRTHLLQTQYPYPDNPITDFDFLNYNPQQPVAMDGALL
ncbi:hypothetical protein FGADI_10314 [Fusarium gaditjirri]|uniref:C2H2-type domain-containing protein n=1 Tax=Fusarium gaditjirri TaxID=282569 RepID=A0A8H4WQY4_9HYPO|nr:hypothetical protein FGADI_10314 [Fusarium gaditjirri]